jgi:hypothetical protein
MSPKYLNPYSFIGANYSAGMDAVAATLNPLYPNQTIDDIVNAVYTYVLATYPINGSATPPDPATAQSLKTLIYTIVNGYLNMESGECLEYNPLQMEFISQLLTGVLHAGDPQNIQQHILDVEEEVTASKLTADQQRPILFATAVGNSAYQYWAGVITGLPTGNWNPFITSFTPPIVKFPYWIATAIEGTLIGLNMYDQNSTVLQANSLSSAIGSAVNLFLDIKGVNIYLSLFGALPVSAAKVVFNYQPRAITPCSGLPAAANEFVVLDAASQDSGCGCNS